jgi:hypothetical protein
VAGRRLLSDSPTCHCAPARADVDWCSANGHVRAKYPVPPMTRQHMKDAAFGAVAAFAFAVLAPRRRRSSASSSARVCSQTSAANFKTDEERRSLWL